MASDSATTNIVDSPTPLRSMIGLANIGNTCFLNVVLQALRLCPPMGELCLKHPDKDIEPRAESKKKGILSAFQTLMRDFWKTITPVGAHPTLVPRGFFHTLHAVLRDTGDDWYRPGQQADAAEALQYILDSLHDSMYRSVKMDVSGSASTAEEISQVKAVESWSSFYSKEYSSIIQNFHGQTQICVTCIKCKNRTERYEPWLMIKAPIPGAEVVGGPAPTMHACIENAFASESLTDYECVVCKEKGEAKITPRISRLPPVTIVTVKRFTNSGSKVRGKISWDLNTMDFTPWMAFRRDPYTDSRESPIYTTFAVIEHHGSTHGGHYRMYARQDGAWNQYDDNSVREVTPDSVITADSYIAFMVPKAHMDSMNHTFAKYIDHFRASCPSLPAAEA